MVNRRMCFRRLGHFVAGVLGIFYFGVDTILPGPALADPFSVVNYTILWGAYLTKTKNPNRKYLSPVRFLLIDLLLYLIIIPSNLA